MLKIIIPIVLLIGQIISVNAQTTRHALSLRDTITDVSVVYPPDMERNYDELLTRWSNGIKSANSCFANSDEQVIYPDSVYIQRLYSLPTQMELVFNPVVKDYISMYAGRRRSLVSYMLGKGSYYFPMFEEALDREGMPMELKYLPIIESALNPIAKSRVGATGLWQFMAGTGRMYDLEINSLVDERRDPQKSTTAAVKYLKDLHNIYGDWNLVIAAYNCGPGNVNKAIKRSGGATDYWAIYPYLPRETRGYVPAFIAATYIMNYYNEHNICPSEPDLPASLDTLVVDKNIHFVQLSEVLNVSIDDIRNYNPQFKNDIIPGEYKHYALSLPIDKISSFIDNKDTILAYKTQELLTHRKVAGLDVVGRGSEGSVTYRVKRGETLASIARTHGVTVAQIKRWNGLRSNSVASGRRLKIELPVKKEQEVVESSQQEEVAVVQNQGIGVVQTTADPKTGSLIKTKKVPQVKTEYYKVKRGETLAGVAKKNQVSVADLKKWNNLKRGLVAGRTIKIERTEYIEIEEIVKLPEPRLTAVSISTTHLMGMVGDYIDKVDRDVSSLPRINIAEEDAEIEYYRALNSNSKTIYHKVKIGETLPQIAAKYNVSRKEIMEWNNLSSKIAKVGQRLMIRLPQDFDLTEESSQRRN